MSIVCVLDASLLLTLGHADALPILWDCQRYSWALTPIVRAEVRTDPTRTALDNAVLNGDVSLEHIDSSLPLEMAALAEWSELVDAGEAEAIAVAICRGWHLATEDRYAQRAMANRVGSNRWINCAGVLVTAIDEGHLDLAEAEDVFARLDCHAGYAKSGVDTLGQLLSTDAVSQ